MPPGIDVGLGPGHIVLDDPAHLPRKGGTGPQSSAHVYCGQTAAWIKIPVGIMEVAQLLPKRGTASQFLAHVCCSIFSPPVISTTSRELRRDFNIPSVLHVELCSLCVLYFPLLIIDIQHYNFIVLSCVMLPVYLAIQLFKLQRCHNRVEMTVRIAQCPTALSMCPPWFLGWLRPCAQYHHHHHTPQPFTALFPGPPG